MKKLVGFTIFNTNLHLWVSQVTPPNQSRPLRKSDGSDFFIARLWQIYQTALIFGKSCGSGFLQCMCELRRVCHMCHVIA